MIDGWKPKLNDQPIESVCDLEVIFVIASRTVKNNRVLGDIARRGSLNSPQNGWKPGRRGRKGMIEGERRLLVIREQNV